MDETRAIRLKRLIYQASYTGMKETDLLLGHFAVAHLGTLDDQALDDFEALLEAGDDRICKHCCMVLKLCLKAHPTKGGPLVLRTEPRSSIVSVTALRGRSPAPLPRPRVLAIEDNHRDDGTCLHMPYPLQRKDLQQILLRIHYCVYGQ